MAISSSLLISFFAMGGIYVTESRHLKHTWHLTSKPAVLNTAARLYSVKHHPAHLRHPRHRTQKHPFLWGVCRRCTCWHCRCLKPAEISPAPSVSLSLLSPTFPFSFSLFLKKYRKCKFLFLGFKMPFWAMYGGEGRHREELTGVWIGSPCYFH